MVPAEAGCSSDLVSAQLPELFGLNPFKTGSTSRRFIRRTESRSSSSQATLRHRMTPVERVPMAVALFPR